MSAQLARGPLASAWPALPPLVPGMLDGLTVCLVLLAVSALVLPSWTARPRRAWRLPSPAEPARLSTDPGWGAPTLWARVLVRTPVPWTIALALLLGVLLVAGRPPWVWGMEAALLTALAAAPLAHVLAAEYECPQRWHLAPDPERVMRSTVLWVAVPSAAAAAAIALWIGWGSWRWTAAVAALLIVSALSPLVFDAAARRLLQAACLVLALSTQALR